MRGGVPDNEPWGLWVGKGGDTLGYELTECMAVIRQGHPPAGPGPLHSEFAIVSNELRNLKAEFNQLSRQHQRVQTRYEELQLEVKALRVERELQEREVAALRRIADTAHTERLAAEASAAENKEYAHKIETRLALSTPSDNHNQQLVLRTKAKLREQRDAAVAEAAAAKELCREQQSELHALRRALKLRADELVAEASTDGDQGNADVTAALLYAVAHGREQLAVASVAAEAAAEEARRREGAVASEAGRVTELQAALAAEREGRAVAQAEAGALRGLADEEARARGELAALLQRAREEATAATEAVEAARRRGLDALQQEQDRNARERSKLEEALATARRNCAAAMEAARQAADGGAEMAELRRQVESERAAASAAARNSAAREQRLQEELAELHAELDSFTEVNERIQAEATAATASAVAERRRLVALESQVVGLEAQVAVGRSERSTAESAMRGRLQAALEALAEATAERDTLRSTLHELTARSQAAITQAESFRAENAQLRQANHTLLASKALLQHTVVEQAAVAESVAADCSAAASHEVAASIDAHGQRSAALEAMVQSERRSHEALAKQYESLFLSSNAAAVEGDSGHAAHMQQMGSPRSTSEAGVRSPVAAVVSCAPESSRGRTLPPAHGVRPAGRASAYSVKSRPSQHSAATHSPTLSELAGGDLGVM